jgi:hypothetical protein
VTVFSFASTGTVVSSAWMRSALMTWVLFDAHHLNPLACGIRQSRVDDFAILCPTWSRNIFENIVELLHLKYRRLR